jgi:translation initiation factor IF-1
MLTKRVRAKNGPVLTAQTVRLRAIAGRPGIDCAAGPETFQGRAAGKVTRIDHVNSEKAIELEGTILSVLPGTMFRVALANDHLVLAHISGKMRKRFIRLTIGDRVKMEMSPYDTAKARIVYRL